jgi:hypothetical protein
MIGYICNVIGSTVTYPVYIPSVYSALQVRDSVRCPQQPKGRAWGGAQVQCNRAAPRPGPGI